MGGVLTVAAGGGSERDGCGGCGGSDGGGSGGARRGRFLELILCVLLLNSSTNIFCQWPVKDGL